MIGIPLGLVYANAGEWALHKYVLHGLGKNKKSFWAFHWHDHHRASRRNDMVDPVYRQSLLHWTPKTKEAVSLLGLALVHAPLFPLAPFFTATVLGSIANYYRVHARAHKDPAWARAHLAWHVDHHLGKNQNLNWCVTHPFFDWVMGTRQRGEATPLAPTAPA
jgi:hypothetical protein